MEVMHAPQECVLNRTREQNVDVPVPQFKEDGLQLVPQERVLNRTREQNVDVPVPQFKEDERLAARTTGDRAELCAGTDCRRASAPV